MQRPDVGLGRSPLLSICIDTTSDTLPAVLSGNHFVVNILASYQEALARRFASKGFHKFNGLPWRPARIAAGAPILHDTVGHLGCRVVQRVEAGDHWLFIAEIMDGTCCEEIEPLIYCRRGYACRQSERLYG